MTCSKKLMKKRNLYVWIISIYSEVQKTRNCFIAKKNQQRLSIDSQGICENKLRKWGEKKQWIHSWDIYSQALGKKNTDKNYRIKILKPDAKN